MGCKPYYADYTKDFNTSNQIKLLRRENEILKNAIRQISKITLESNHAKEIADMVLLAIGE